MDSVLGYGIILVVRAIQIVVVVKLVIVRGVVLRSLVGHV